MPTQYPYYDQDDPHLDPLFLSARAKRNRVKQYKESPIEILPGYTSIDPQMLRFKDLLSTRLSKRHEPCVDELGRVYGNGVRSNFLGLRHVNGFPMKPATIPLADNTYLREQQGLANRFVKPWHEFLFRGLVRCFFSDLEPEAMKLRVGSSSMAPYYETDMLKKKDIARQALASGKVAGELMIKGDYAQAWLRHGVGGPCHTVYRRQSSDGISYDPKTKEYTFKERPTSDLEYSLSGGRKGLRTPASKSVDDIDAPIPKGFARERNRTAQGVPLGMNAVLMPIAQPVRTHLYKEYPLTFHHTSREEKEKKFRNWIISINADVAQHDQMWGTFIVDVVADELLKMGYAPWWVELYRTRIKLPLFFTDVGPGIRNGMIGDWTNPSIRGGLPSGNAFTDIDGTLMMTFCYCVVQIEHTYQQAISFIKDVRSATQFAHKYLRWELPIQLADKSDDAKLGWEDPALRLKAMQLHQKMKAGEKISDYMTISYEHGGAFLGDLDLFPRDFDYSRVTLVGNIVSYIINQFSPEYSVQSSVKDRSRTRRPFPGLAWESYPQVYGSSPIYGYVLEEIERTWHECFGFSYSSYRQKLLQEDKDKLFQFAKTRSIHVPDLTPIDAEVLASADKLMYKYSPDDVSPGVADMIFSGLTLEEVEPFFNSVFHK